MSHKSLFLLITLDPYSRSGVLGVSAMRQQRAAPDPRCAGHQRPGWLSAPSLFSTVSGFGLIIYVMNQLPKLYRRKGFKPFFKTSIASESEASHVARWLRR